MVCIVAKNLRVGTWVITKTQPRTCTSSFSGFGVKNFPSKDCQIFRVFIFPSNPLESHLGFRLFSGLKPSLQAGLMEEMATRQTTFLCFVDAFQTNRTTGRYGGGRWRRFLQFLWVFWSPGSTSQAFSCKAQGDRHHHGGPKCESICGHGREPSCHG